MWHLTEISDNFWRKLEGLWYSNLQKGLLPTENQARMQSVKFGDFQLSLFTFSFACQLVSVVSIHNLRYTIFKIPLNASQFSVICLIQFEFFLPVGPNTHYLGGNEVSVRVVSHRRCQFITGKNN